ncbi:hypothetical protein B0H14DRAFT_3538456 [Mycena olivaceomarginata]|nr:hypothetical protein B0H14DRAFT_3538456 [Mycena olivaceomarginata]
MPTPGRPPLSYLSYLPHNAQHTTVAPYTIPKSLPSLLPSPRSRSLSLPLLPSLPCSPRSLSSPSSLRLASPPLPSLHLACFARSPPLPPHPTFATASIPPFPLPANRLPSTRLSTTPRSASPRSLAFSPHYPPCHPMDSPSRPLWVSGCIPLAPKHQWIIAHIRLATNENERHIRAEMSHLLDPLRNVKPALSNRCKEIHLFLHVTERGLSGRMTLVGVLPPLPSPPPLLASLPPPRSLPLPSPPSPRFRSLPSPFLPPSLARSPRSPPSPRSLSSSIPSLLPSLPSLAPSPSLPCSPPSPRSLAPLPSLPCSRSLAPLPSPRYLTRSVLVPRSLVSFPHCFPLAPPHRSLPSPLVPPHCSPHSLFTLNLDLYPPPESTIMPWLLQPGEKLAKAFHLSPHSDEMAKMRLRFREIGLKHLDLSVTMGKQQTATLSRIEQELKATFSEFNHAELGALRLGLTMAYIKTYGGDQRSRRKPRTANPPQTKTTESTDDTDSTDDEYKSSVGFGSGTDFNFIAATPIIKDFLESFEPSLLYLHPTFIQAGITSQEHLDSIALWPRFNLVEFLGGLEDPVAGKGQTLRKVVV